MKWTRDLPWTHVDVEHPLKVRFFIQHSSRGILGMVPPVDHICLVSGCHSRSHAVRVAVAVLYNQALLSYGLSHPVLRDEIYAHVLKQMISNPNMVFAYHYPITYIMNTPAA